MTSKLDATRYRWREWNTSNPFAGIVHNTELPVSVGDVQFDDKSFGRCDYTKNGEHWTFYGSGSIYDYAAVQLADGDVLFCVVRGSQFTDTFHSADEIHMRYYRLTPLPE